MIIATEMIKNTNIACSASRTVNSGYLFCSLSLLSFKSCSTHKRCFRSFCFQAFNTNSCWIGSEGLCFPRYRQPVLFAYMTRSLADDDVFFVHRCRCFACNVGRAVLLRHPFVRYVSDHGHLVYKPVLTKGINNKLVGR